MIVAVDLDHTMRHSAWRDEHIDWAKESGEWDYYHGLSKEDIPSLPIVSLVTALHTAGHEIYIVTAIPRKWLRQNYAWLMKAGLGFIDQDHILMRPDGDDAFRPSPQMKEELLAHLSVDLLIEDRLDVVEHFASLGITTLQVRLVS